MPSARTSQMAWLKFLSVPHRLLASVRDHGLLAACRRVWRRAGETLRERRLGIRTVGSIDAAALNSGADSFGYQPIPYAALETALQAVGVGRNDVFIDMGCGMGRAVVLAGLSSLRRAIGVEISWELCLLARQNVDRARRRLKTPDVNIVHADARDYTVPDDATVLLLFNPFNEPTLRCMLENVRQSLDRAPRVLTIIYAIPAARRDLLADVSWLQLDQTLSITDEEWLQLGIYRTKRGAA